MRYLIVISLLLALLISTVDSDVMEYRYDNHAGAGAAASRTTLATGHPSNILTYFDRIYVALFQENKVLIGRKLAFDVTLQRCVLRVRITAHRTSEPTGHHHPTGCIQVIR
jgi:hypothetical protein